jgi:hypothetical protein
MTKAADKPESFSIRERDLRRANLRRFPYHFLFRVVGHEIRKRGILAEGKLWRFVAALHINRLHVLVVLPFRGDIKNPSLMRF